MNDIIYATTKLDQLSVEMALQANGITFEKSQIYSDFVMHLINTCFNTYPGDNVMDKQSDMNHFNWCFDKSKSIFNKYGLIPSDKLKLFMKDFMFDLYYSSDDKVMAKDTTTMFFRDLFDHRQPKTMADIECFIGIYLIFQDGK